MGFDNGGDQRGCDNGGDRRGGDWWVARLAWWRSVGGEIGGLGFDFAMNFEFRFWLDGETRL